jgi:hypothetical protein
MEQEHHGEAEDARHELKGKDLKVRSFCVAAALSRRLTPIFY